MKSIPTTAREMIERLKGALATTMQDHESAEQALQREIGIVEGHAVLAERLENARAEMESASQRLAEVCATDFTTTIGQRLSSDWNQLWPLAQEMCRVDWIKGHKEMLLAEVQKETVGQAEEALRGYERQHRDTLRKHKAIS